MSLAVAGALAGQARAVNATQTVDGIVNVVYWDLDRFWAGLWPANQDPGIGYFNYVDGSGRTVQYHVPGCGWTTGYVGYQGFYCSATPNGEIHFDFAQQHAHLRGIGDGAVAMWLAHEYGHHAQRMLGYNWRASPPYHELLADCFAGLYFRWGVRTSGALAEGDYREARRMLSYASYDRDHGTATQRLRAFDYGYRSIGYRACVNGWRNW
jgi:predicted metalloprotease